MNAPMDLDEQDNGLLDRTTTIMEAEMALTRIIEKVDPWLKDAQVNPHQPRVRPIPTSMEEAKAILSVARNLSNRTSAPAGWNPGAPITNFATPNPLPNQLRGGALAALQLERAKQQQADKKRLMEAETEAEKQKQLKREEPSAVAQQQQQQQQQQQKQHQPQAAHHRRPTQQQTHKPKPVVSMNLSDSSSDEEDDE